MADEHPTRDLVETLRHVGAGIGGVLDRHGSSTGPASTERTFRAIIEHSSDVVAILDGSGEIRYVSPSSEGLLGVAATATPTEGRLQIHVDDIDVVHESLGSLPAGASSQPFELRVHRPGDGWRDLEILATNLLEDPDVRGIVLHCRDVTARHHAAERLEHERFHDPLTGCPTRALFAKHLERALARERRHHGGLAVFAVDLNGLGAINELHGHDVGDAVLVAVAGRIEAALRAYDSVSRPGPIVSRFGGDEFYALCEDFGIEIDAPGVRRRLADAISQPLTVDDIEIAVTATIGVAFARGGDVHHDALMAQASTAMQRMKDGALTRLEVGDADEPDGTERHDGAIDELRDAIEHGQLRLHYQPKVDAFSGQLRGVEALVRWEHPSRGLVPPVQFIALAEASGLIGPLGSWVLNEACRQQAAWTTSLGPDAPALMCVNVSSHQLVGRFVDELGRTAAEHGVATESVCVEITESAVMGDVESAVGIVRDLKALGVVVAIDDFGTGYSSLSHLKRFPVDEVKIDKSFVDGLGADPEDTAIVAAIIAMSHALGLLVIAEGVETMNQLVRLRNLGCEMAQGYLFSRPVPPDDLVGLGTVIRPRDVDHPDPSSPAAADIVLIVDDTADVRQLARVSLATSGFEVREATTGSEAIRAARLARPSCIVLDVSMPGMDGFEVCRALRADPLTAGIAVVMLTSRADASDKVDAFSAGADDYMLKPFAPRELVSRVRQAMSRRAGQLGGQA